jgi:DNA polymerase III subunit delta
MEELLEAIGSGDLDPIYVLSSEHPILIDRVLTALREIVVPPAARGFNYDVVEGKPTAMRIVALAQTLPMMAARRMVYVRDLGGMPADEAEPLLAYVAKPNPSTVIAAVTSKLDKRIKLYSTLAKKGYVHVLDAPKTQALPAWIRAEAKERGVALDPAAVSRLVDAVGGDVSRLALTIEQLGLFVHRPGAAQRAVTADDVDELIADTRERSVFELTDAIGAADRVRALAAVAKLVDQRESAVGVVVMLARHVRQLGLVHALRAAGAPRHEWGAKLGVPPFLVDKIAGQARTFTPEALAAATERLAIADRALKGDQTLIDTRFTGPQLKAMGKDLGERVILETVVDGIVQLAG